MFKHLLERLVLLKSEGLRYAVTSISKEEFKNLNDLCSIRDRGEINDFDFMSKAGLPISSVFLYGEADVTKFICRPTAKQRAALINNKRIIDNILDKTMVVNEITGSKESYICTCGRVYGLDYTKQVLHSTPFSAWDCALTKMGRPEYCLVLLLNRLDDYNIEYKLDYED